MGRGQELLDAAREGDRRTVEKIVGQICKRSGPFTSLRRGAGINVQDDNGYTPLHHACLNGHREIVRILLSAENPASPCIADKKGATPLHLAAFNGHSEVVRMLLAHNNPPVNIDQLTLMHETALILAAQFGHTDVVAQLIARGADVTIKNDEQETALDLAAQYGRIATVEHLLTYKPELIDMYRTPLRDGYIFSSTPLHRAAIFGRKKVVAALLKAGVDPNVRTESGTPLHEAACLARADIVRLLLRRGADLRARDKRGKTVQDLLAERPEEETRKVREVIREYKERHLYDSEEDLPPFPVHDSSPTAPMTAPETQKKSNKNDSLLSSSPSLTKNHPQSFVKKLASKCLGLKAKFNSAPNISNNIGTESEVDVSTKRTDKSNANTLLIGNSKFFNKILSKKEESGEIVCNDEFDTISLDRLGTLNRDSVVNRSNRSCPGFKTSLPNISENNEISDHDSLAESVIITELDCDKNKGIVENVNEAVNAYPKLDIFEPRERVSIMSNGSSGSTNLVNECYESYEFHESNDVTKSNNSIPRPLPRPQLVNDKKNQETLIYENVNNLRPKPTPAARTHIPLKLPLDEVERKELYENVSLLRHKKPEPPKRTILPAQIKLPRTEKTPSPSVSRSSTLSSDSMVDETNLEDILLSEKSKSFRHGVSPSFYSESYKTRAHRTHSNVSDSSDVTEASAIENVDCSDDAESKALYLSMTGTLPSNKTDSKEKKKVLFRHKTFTNIEVDRNSVKVKDFPRWDSEFLKETLPHYHIRGTGHCIYQAPTVQEFIYVFNRDTLYKDVPPFIKVPNENRDSYFETAICFCKPRPPKHHNSAEDLLERIPKDEEEKVIIDFEALKDRREVIATSFVCFCDSGTCRLHSNRRETANDFVVKFSAIKKSISTPDITLNLFPSSTIPRRLPKNKSVPNNLEEPYAVVSVDDIIKRDKSDHKSEDNEVYTTMSHPSTLSSSASRLYSIKDISEVISFNDQSTSTTSTLSNACEMHLPVRKSSSSEYSGHWSLQTCNSNVTIKSDLSFKTCLEESSDDNSEGTLHSDDESEAETIKSDVSTSKRPWVRSDSFRIGPNTKPEIDTIAEEYQSSFEDNKFESMSSKFESGISVEDSESSSSGGEDDSGVPRVGRDVSLGASLERVSVGGVRSGSGRRRWDEAEGTSEGDALSISSAASSCAPLHLVHHHDYSKVSPTPPKKPPRRNLSVSPTHANSPSSGYSYELRVHARSQDDLDDIQSSKHYLKHGRSVDHYDSKLSYSEYEENHNSPRLIPIPNPRPSLKQRSQPVAITAMYENVVIKEQNPRRKLRRNLEPSNVSNNYDRMTDRRKYSVQERSSLESLLDDQSMNSPSDCERYYEGPRVAIPLSPTHYEQPPTPDHPPPSAKQAENSIHERIRPLSQEYKRRSQLRDSFTETEVSLLRAASAASVASGATDRSGNTDNCVEEYVCDVPFADEKPMDMDPKLPKII